MTRMEDMIFTIRRVRDGCGGGEDHGTVAPDGEADD